MKHFKPRFAVKTESAPRCAAARETGAVLSIAAPMKINLALHILGKRADGYHALESLAVFSGQGDRLHFSNAGRDSFSIDGVYAARLGRSRNNLVLRARDKMRALLGAQAVPPVAIRLTKNLPVAAGLGGGSADAAAVLAGLSELNGPDKRGLNSAENAAQGAAHSAPSVPPPALAQLAAELGADVPMCLAWFYRKTAYLAGGKGEILQTLPYFPSLSLVVVNNGAPLSTRLVFSAYAGQAGAGLPKAEDLMKRRDFTEQTTFFHSLRNDLYEPALRIMPELAEVMQLLRSSGAAFCAMSGSGASLFGLYPNRRAAEAAAAFIRARAGGYFIAAVETDGAPASL